MNVAILCPAHSVSVDAYYHHSVINTIKAGFKQGIDVCELTWPGEALVQHARNALVELALKDARKFENFVWIDSDQEFTPRQFLALLDHDVDVVGGTYRKKQDEEAYEVRVSEVTEIGGLWKVMGLGTGFLKVSREALETVYRHSEVYENKGQKFRAVFEVPIINGRLYGEDTIFCEKLQAAGFDIYLDPSVTVGHNGHKRYKGDFQAFIDRIKTEAETCK